MDINNSPVQGGNSPSDSNFLQVQSGIDTTLRAVENAKGNVSALKLATDKASINGNFGVGTDTPGTKLEIDHNGDSGAAFKITNAGSARADLYNSTITDSGDNAATWTISNQGTLNLSAVNFSGVQFQIGASGKTWSGACEHYLKSSTTTDALIIGVSNVTATNTTHFQVDANGDTRNTNNVFAAISDERDKENIDVATDKLAEAMQIIFRSFNFIGDTKKQLGVIAQELELIFPGLIEEVPLFETILDPDWQPKLINVPDTQTISKEIQTIELIEGQYRKITKIIQEEKPIFDNVQIYDEFGNIIEGEFISIQRMKKVLEEEENRPMITVPVYEADGVTQRTRKSVKYSILCLIFCKAFQEFVIESRSDALLLMKLSSGLLTPELTNQLNARLAVLDPVA